MNVNVQIGENIDFDLIRIKMRFLAKNKKGISPKITKNKIDELKIDQDVTENNELETLNSFKRNEMA